MHVLITCKYKMIGSKTAEKNTIYPIITLWELSVAMETRVQSNQIWPETLLRLSPNPIMLKIKFDCDRPAGLREIFMLESVNTRTD